MFSFIAMTLSLSISTVFENDWILESKTDHFKQYKSAAHAEPITYMLMAEVPHQPVKILPLVHIHDGCASWVKGCRTAEITRSTSKYNYEYYTTFNFPWPYQLRDEILEVSTTEYLNGYYVRVRSIEDAPKNQGYTRMKSDIKYYIVEKDDNSSILIWVITSHFGGNITDNITNKAIKNGTKESFEKLLSLTTSINH